jgi:hypothetical protein
MPRDTKQVEAQVAAAKKQVHFELTDLAKQHPTEDKIPKTAMRRHSLDPSQLPANDGRTATLRPDDGDDAASTTVLADEFDENCPVNVLANFDMMTADHHATIDLPERLEALAAHFGKKGTSPGMPFAPMTEDGKAQWPAFDGVMDLGAFKAKADENPEALFNEMKLRTLIMIAREQQMDDMYRFLKTVQGERDILYGWCTTFSKELRHVAALTMDDAERHRLDNRMKIGLSQATERLEAMQNELAEKDTRIQELQEHATELSMAITRNRGFTPASAHSDRTEGGSRRSEKFTDPPFFYNDPTQKDAIDFDDWYLRVKEKLNINKDHFETDVARRAYVRSRLRGNAAKQMFPYFNEKSPNYLATYDELMDHLWNEYHDKAEEDNNLDAYDGLHMQPGADASAFRNDFVRLAGMVNKPKTEWKREFYRKLTTSLQSAVAREYLDNAVDFRKLADQAIQIAQIHKRVNAARTAAKTATTQPGGNTRRTTSSTTTSTTTTPNPARTPAAFRPRFPQGGRAPRARIPVDKLKKLIEEGRCFTCEQQGHTSSECPNKNNSADRAARIQAIVDKYGDPGTEPREEETAEVTETVAEN